MEQKIITVDNKVEDILELLKDQANDIFFEADPERFLVLTADDLKRIPDRLIRERYTAAKVARDALLSRRSEDEIFDDIAFGGYAENMAGYMDIRKPDPNKDYYMAAQEKVMSKKRKGFTLDRVKTKGKVHTNKTVNGLKKTGLSNELVLMSRPKKLAEERQKKRDADYEAMFTGRVDGLRENLEREAKDLEGSTKVFDYSKE